MIGRDSGPQFQDWGALPVRNHWLESRHVSVQQVGCLVFVLVSAVIWATHMCWTHVAKLQPLLACNFKCKLLFCVCVGINMSCLYVLLWHE